MAMEFFVNAEQWSPRGEAVATNSRGNRLQIWQGIPGEEARVRVIHQGQNESSGHWLEAKEPHPDRVYPSCPKYVGCGGCPLMHVSEEGQWRARRSLVERALEQYGLEDVSIGQQHDSPGGRGEYRSLVKVGAGYSDQGHIRLGAWGRRTKHIVPIPKCEVAAPPLLRTMKALAHHVIDLDLHPYDPTTERGVIRSAVMRMSQTSGEVLVTLVVGRRMRLLRELAENLAAEVSDVVGVWVHTNQDPGNAIFERGVDGSVGVRPLAGRAWIEETMDGLTYRIGPADFFQTNPAMAQVLYARVMQRLNLEKGTPYVDLYCGVGGLALQGARRTGWALGVEEVHGAVLRARENARRNHLTAEFLSDSVEYALLEVQKRLSGRQPVVTVNPPRRGLEPGVVERLMALSPRRIGYVSCNPLSLARDLALLRAEGFSIGEIELFDMFPHTAHVECLVVLDHPKRAGGRRAPTRKVVRK